LMGTCFPEPAVSDRISLCGGGADPHGEQVRPPRKQADTLGQRGFRDAAVIPGTVRYSAREMARATTGPVGRVALTFTLGYGLLRLYWA